MSGPAEAVTATRHWRDLPGPRGVPIFGNALSVDKQRVHEDFAEWSRRYGPTFAFAWGRAGCCSSPTTR